ncbi:capsule assembly Wzi family protein [Salmonirosea aquatica]|uniref:Capsule assembly Wzi family protein n=1 Tax=Salmonirosea aquatica TaxID=2654236 RepID=A0A7C9FQY5_9BACT|nr:hypothetical protein [Cytophagaceae bacterium SJW1-29]
MRNYLAGFFILLSISFTQAQDSTFSYHAAVQGAVTTSQTPFWLHANQFSKVPVQGPYVAGQLGFYRNYSRAKSPKKIFDWSAGAELGAYIGPVPDLFLTDAFVAGKLGAFELSIGQRKETFGLMDTTLTSGSLSFSGNSRPYPRIQLAFPQFISLGFIKHFVAFKGSYSDGFLGTARVQYGNVNEIPHVYMHHKALYIRLGKPAHRLHLYGGFNHQAMWGGEDKIFTGGLKPLLAYKYVVIGKSWAASRVGNHFGTIDMGAEWTGKKWSYFGYRQNIYEDGSLAGLTNIADGLNGFRMKRNGAVSRSDLQIKILTIEILNTKSQGGSVFDYDNHIFGRDNYYNHYVYTQGWSYRGRIMGTPLVPTQDIQKLDLLKDTTALTMNNRLLAFHAGVLGQVQNINIQAKGTFSRNLGTYNYPLEPARNQFSFILQAEKPVSFANGSFLSLRLATDLGTLYPTNFGVEVGWQKRGFL